MKLDEAEFSRLIRSQRQPTTFAELQGMTLEELYEQYEAWAVNGDTLDLMFWGGEISRRAQAEATNAMLMATQRMKNLTILIAFLTAANVGIAVALLLISS